MAEFERYHIDFVHMLRNNHTERAKRAKRQGMLQYLHVNCSQFTQPIVEAYLATNTDFLDELNTGDISEGVQGMIGAYAQSLEVDCSDAQIIYICLWYTCLCMC